MDPNNFSVRALGALIDDPKRTILQEPLGIFQKPLGLLQPGGEPKWGLTDLILKTSGGLTDHP